jgi:hypothetical protein
MSVIETAITEAEAGDFHALLVKARMALYFAQEGGGAALRDGHPDESRDVLASLVRDLRRLAGVGPDRLAVGGAPLLPIPALAAAGAGDPLVGLLAEYFRCIDIANACQTDDELDAAGDVVAGIRESMLAIPAVTIEGVIAKLGVAREAGLSELDIDGKFARAALADLERMAAGGAA